MIHGLQLILTDQFDIKGKALSFTEANRAHKSSSTWISQHERFAVSIRAGQVLFDIISSEPIDNIALAYGGLAPEIYTGSQTIDTRTIVIRRSAKDQDAVPFVVYQNEPNPWDAQTMIGVDAPSRGEGILRIFDLGGRLLHSRNLDLDYGYNEVWLKKADLPVISGVLLYEVEFDGQTETRKMILVD